MSFTPGPWKTVKDNHIGLILPMGSSVSYRIVFSKQHGDVAYTETNENARLIATAPELLHFVKEVKRVANEGMLTPEWEKLAAKLIEKAEGK